MFVDERFINKAQFDAGFAHRLILKDGAVPAIKYPVHDSELQTVSETASDVCVLLVIALKCLSLFSSTNGAHPGAKTVSFFYKYDKTKDFWRYEGRSSTL